MKRIFLAAALVAAPLSANAASVLSEFSVSAGWSVNMGSATFLDGGDASSMVTFGHWGDGGDASQIADGLLEQINTPVAAAASRAAVRPPSGTQLQFGTRGMTTAASPMAYFGYTEYETPTWGVGFGCEDRGNCSDFAPVLLELNYSLFAHAVDMANVAGATSSAIARSRVAFSAPADIFNDPTYNMVDQSVTDGSMTGTFRILLQPGQAINATLFADVYGTANFDPNVAPVPVPASLGFALAGLGALGFMAARRNRRQAA